MQPPHSSRTARSERENTNRTSAPARSQHKSLQICIFIRLQGWENWLPETPEPEARLGATKEMFRNDANFENHRIFYFPANFGSHHENNWVGEFARENVGSKKTRRNSGFRRNPERRQ